MVTAATLFTDWRRPTFITSLNPGLLGYDRLLRNLHPRVELIEVRLDGAWAASTAFIGKAEEYARAAAIVRQAREISGRPILATFRTEGERIAISTSAYEDLCASLGEVADYVDIEANYPLRTADFSTAAAAGSEALARAREDAEKPLRKLIVHVQRQGAQALLSQHFWNSGPTSPQEIVDLFMHQVELGADIAKLAYTPSSQSELQLIQQGGRLSYQLVHKPTILIGMGEIGKPTRLAGPQAGNWGTFVTVGGLPSAPGQLPLGQLELRYPLGSL